MKYAIHRAGAVAAMVGGALWIIAGAHLLPLGAMQPWGRVPLVIAPLLIVNALAPLCTRLQTPTPAARIGLGLARLGAIGLAFGALQPVIALVWPQLSGLLTLIGHGGVLVFNLGVIMVGMAITQEARGEGWHSLPLVIGLIGLFLPIGGGIAGIVGAWVWLLWGLGWVWLGAIVWLEPQLSAVRSRAR